MMANIDESTFIPFGWLTVNGDRCMIVKTELIQCDFGKHVIVSMDYNV